MAKRNYLKEHLDYLEKGEDLSPQDIKFKEHVDRSMTQYNAAARGVVGELKENGFDITIIQDLRTSGQKYPSAIPILMKWLPEIKYEPLKNDIVRTLTVPWGKPAADLLIDEFNRSTSKKDQNYRANVGNALRVVAQKKHFPELAAIVRDRSAGYTRRMVIRALGRIKHPNSASVLLELLPDDGEIGHVIDMLRRLKARVPRDLVEPHLTHELPWVRKEAKKLLELQDKLDAQEP